ncbi:hypothetical protein BC830DRAFT_1172358 [Chytriomyces sp. MP71]|nr:hypothetical protein BC830DRAFT_1172358 [Chytriomyces sp. MP71]
MLPALLLVYLTTTTLAVQLLQEPLLIDANSASVSSSSQGLVYLIKHGEKPSNRKQRNLNDRGLKRAKCLAEKYGTQGLDGIFCPKYNTKTLAHSRSCKTVEPLAKAASINLNSQYKTHDVQGVVAAIREQAKHGAVLVAWQHDYLAEIATALVGRKIKYKSGEFDTLWMYNTVTGEFVEGKQNC